MSESQISQTNINPKECWECPICGYLKCKGLVHFCPTASKPRPIYYPARELNLAPLNCKDENELTRTQWAEYYKKMGLE